jgi:hypothetical protein
VEFLDLGGDVKSALWEIFVLAEEDVVGDSGRNDLSWAIFAEFVVDFDNFIQEMSFEY